MMLLHPCMCWTVSSGYLGGVFWLDRRCSLSRSHLLDAVVDVMAESVSIFPFKERHEHVGLVLLLLDVTKLVFGWM